MFTGLVADLGTVSGAERTGGGVRITIKSGLTTELAEGDSVAVNGVCLTATEVGGGTFTADVMNETLGAELAGSRSRPAARSTLSSRCGPATGSAAMSSRGTSTGWGGSRSVLEDGFARRVEIAAPRELMRYVVHKGSIAVDGVSLTVAELDNESFTVSLIPETLQRTNLGTVAPGSTVNLEVDVLAKYVERLVRTAV